MNPINTLLNKKQRVFKLFIQDYWLKQIVERQSKVKRYYLIIMTLSSSQQALLRAKKAIGNGDTNFKPRGEKNKAAFEALKKIEAQSHPNKRIKITTASSSSHTPDLASLLDCKPPPYLIESHTSFTTFGGRDEEEVELHPPHKELDGAMLAKLNAHKEQIKKKEQRMTNELSKQTMIKTPSGPWAIKLPPKTKAEQLLEKKEDMKRDYHTRQMQIFRLAEKVKQLDVFSEKYKEFEKQGDLVEWLQDVLKQKEAGLEIEDDDTREAAWLSEKEDRIRKGLHTNIAEYKAKKLFFESNQFLTQPLQITLICKDLLGKLNEDEQSKLKIQVVKLKATLKQEKHPELHKYALGRQLLFLHNWKKNAEILQEKGMWEDDVTRELEIKQREERLKEAEEIVRKQLKEGKVGMLSILSVPRESTVTIEEIHSVTEPMLALQNSAPARTMETETHHVTESDSHDDDTDVEEPPPCPVHLMI